MADRDQFLATVRSNLPLCREHFKLVLHIEAFQQTEPGQFIQIECRDPALRDIDDREIELIPAQSVERHHRELVAPMALLRRPFSLAGRRDVSGGVELDIIHRVVGVGTEWLSRLRAGDQVDILGPLGNRFQLPASDQTAILVGGGVGIPPMLYLATSLDRRKAVAFSGAVSRDLLPLTIDANGDVVEFARHGISSIVSTDDGSFGFHGLVTQALEQYLNDRRAEPSSTIIYTCGPEPMMKRVAEIAAQRKIECQIAVERAMACGMGTCQSCCIRVLKPDPWQPPLAGSNWCYRLACTDGPVFRGDELLW